MKGTTRLRYVPFQTDYIVVDQEFFKWPNPQTDAKTGRNVQKQSYQTGNTWIDSEYTSHDLIKFLQHESIKILQNAVQCVNKSNIHKNILYSNTVN